MNMKVNANMNMHRTVMIGAAVLCGCTELTSLGISSEQIVGRDSADAETAHASALSVAAGELLLPNAYAGDIDGDGLDDVLIGGMHPNGPAGAVPDMTVYLFYGRSSFPETLAAADADATFDTGAMDTLSLGDINGDGLADFVLGDATAYELVFGSKKRFEGHHAKLTTGLQWRYGEPPREGDFFPTRFYRMYSAGDLTGDGASELWIQVSERDPVDSKTALKEYLFEGRKEGWPSGAWDASWTAASFGTDDPANETLHPWSQGDLDGDGKTDIIARQGDRFWLFYGRAAGLHGILTPANADAEIDPGAPYSDAAFGGDIDGDGADDLQLLSSGELQVVYGAKARYSGVVRPQADLTFAGTSGGVQAADLNADGLKDLIITGHAASSKPGLDEFDQTVVYHVQGNGARLTGRYQLQPEQRYTPVGYAAPEPLDSGRFAFIDARSDFDGDGSSDLMMVYLEDVAPEIHGAVYVLPGTSRAPD